MKKNEDLKPLEHRPFKYKKSKMKFYCPLCRSERALTSSYKLSFKNYIQIFIFSVILMLALYPIMNIRAFFVFFVVWGGFELGFRVVYRKELSCPYCGFDAAWYKKSIPVTRKLVDEFWGRTENSQNIPQKEVNNENTMHLQDGIDYNTDQLNDSSQESFSSEISP